MPVAVITGGTRGIGLGLARELARRGTSVVICGRDDVAIKAAIEEISGDVGSARVAGTMCDVTVFDDVQRLWDFAVERFGRVDIWINNAGATTTPVVLWQVPADQPRRVVQTNLLGALYGSKVAVAGMRAQGSGFIYNVEGLGSGGETQVGVTTYGVTKSAVAYLRRALRKELEDSGVKVGAIRPGINITEHLLYGAEALDPKRWERSKRIFNILGDLPETTTPWLASKILSNSKDGAVIRWLTPAKASWRFATAGLNKRDLFASLEGEAVNA